MKKMSFVTPLTSLLLVIALLISLLPTTVQAAPPPKTRTFTVKGKKVAEYPLGTTKIEDDLVTTEMSVVELKKGRRQVTITEYFKVSDMPGVPLSELSLTEAQRDFLASGIREVAQEKKVAITWQIVYKLPSKTVARVSILTQNGVEKVIIEDTTAEPFEPSQANPDERIVYSGVEADQVPVDQYQYLTNYIDESGEFVTVEDIKAWIAENGH